jgi:hypothetical protein
MMSHFKHGILLDKIPNSFNSVNSISYCIEIIEIEIEKRTNNNNNNRVHVYMYYVVERM